MHGMTRNRLADNKKNMVSYRIEKHLLRENTQHENEKNVV